MDLTRLDTFRPESSFIRKSLTFMDPAERDLAFMVFVGKDKVQVKAECDAVINSFYTELLVRSGSHYFDLFTLTHGLWSFKHYSEKVVVQESKGPLNLSGHQSQTDDRSDQTIRGFDIKNSLFGYDVEIPNDDI